MRSFVATSVLLGLASAAAVPAIAPRGGDGYGHGHGHKKFNVQVGVRPYYLVDNMDDGPLKEKLESCSEQEFKTSDFVFAHRGAPLQFPEHTLQSYKAAHRMGAGMIECDVAFTKDKQRIGQRRMYIQKYNATKGVILKLHQVMGASLQISSW